MGDALADDHHVAGACLGERLQTRVVDMVLLRLLLLVLSYSNMFRSLLSVDNFL